ncbi:hypothetical protein M3J09_002487 [Ascochyta lentis]
MTTLYEFWHDLVLGGRYTQEIRMMHKTYGPIVRIGPEELHCNDPHLWTRSMLHQDASATSKPTIWVYW